MSPMIYCNRCLLPCQLRCVRDHEWLKTRETLWQSPYLLKLSLTHEKISSVVDKGKKQHAYNYKVLSEPTIIVYKLALLTLPVSSRLREYYAIDKVCLLIGFSSPLIARHYTVCTSSKYFSQLCSTIQSLYGCKWLVLDEAIYMKSCITLTIFNIFTSDVEYSYKTLQGIIANFPVIRFSMTRHEYKGKGS